MPILKGLSMLLERINRSHRSYIKYMLKYSLYKLGIRCAYNCGLLNDVGEELVGIVHFNAPDYLLLNLKSLSKVLGGVKVIILDNGSFDSAYESVLAIARRFSKTVTIFRNNHLINRMRDHTMGINYIVELAGKLAIDRLIILDQDCILVDPIEDLRSRVPGEAVLAGVRDLRNSFKGFVHPSLMILDVSYFKKLGPSSVYGPPTRFTDKIWEPYYGITYNSIGKIIYIDQTDLPMGNTPFNISAYIYKGRIIAYHSWYSSRMFATKDKILDSQPVETLIARRRFLYTYLNSIIDNIII